MTNLAVLGTSAFSGIFITEFTDEDVTVRNGYISGDSMAYGDAVKLPICYNKPDWSEEEEPCFHYQGWMYFLSEFIMILQKE
jgi:hypothetical protein